MRNAFHALVALVLWHGVANAAAPAAPAPHFSVQEYRVLGNTTLPVRDVERAVYPYLGPDRAFDDVQKARDALQAAYRAHDLGTVLVDIPEQDVSDGVVRLRVTEGRLESVRISGARYFSERKLLAGIPAAAPGTVPHLGELQKQIADVNNQSRDRQIVPVLKAGTQPGTADLALKVEDQLPLHGSAELNNQYTVGTTHLRANLALDYANAFNTLGDLSLAYQLSPEDTAQVGVFTAGYTSGPLINDLRASLVYLHSSSTVPAAGTLGVIGKGDIYGSHLSLPLLLTQSTTQSFLFGADYKHFSQNITASPTTSLQTPVNYINWSVGYLGNWRQPSRQWNLLGSVNFGIRGLVNEPDEFENARYLAPANYMYLREDGAVVQSLPGDWALRLRIAGQYTDAPLVTYEQFSIAGADGVRGYLESEQLGDQAVKGTLQLDSPAAHTRLASGTLFVFYDAGKMWVINALPDTPDHAVLKSVGAGLRLSAPFGLSSILTWAYPLTNSVATQAHESRFLFLVHGAF